MVLLDQASSLVGQLHVVSLWLVETGCDKRTESSREQRHITKRKEHQETWSMSYPSFVICS